MDLKARFSIALLIASALVLGLFAAAVYGRVRDRLALAAEQSLSSHMDREWRHLVQHEGKVSQADDLPGSGESYHQIFRDGMLIVDSRPRSLVDDWPQKITREFMGTIDGKRFRILGFQDLRSNERYLDDLRSVLWWRCLATLLIVAPLSWFFAWLSLKPFRDLSRATLGLDARKLSFRFKEPRLRDEHGVLVRNFNALLERLERSFGQLGRFATNASHELRTPLTVIRGEAEWMLRKPRSTEDYETGLRKIVERADGLQQIVKRLLQFSDIERARWEGTTESIAVRAKVEEMVDVLGKLHPGPRTVTVREGDATLLGASDLFSSVVRNLLENAIKYSRSQIAVAFGQQPDGVWLEIEDDGPGIPAERRTAVFDPLAKFPHGLGLSIVKACLEAARGTIELGQSQWGGLRVRVWFPR